MSQILTYLTITGRILTYRLPPEVTPFMAQLEAAADNGLVDEASFIGLLYGRGNPLLRQDILTGRGTVTPEVFADPLWHVMLDLHGRKRIALGLLDLAAVEACHTLTVGDVAARLGIEEADVRAAIGSFALPAWHAGGRWLVAPEACDAYLLALQLRQDLPRGVLALRCGTAPGFSLQVHLPHAALRRSDRAWVGEVPFDSPVSVLWKRGDSARYFVIEPGDVIGTIANGDFMVRGRFKRTVTINNAAQARAAWARARLRSAEVPAR